MKHTTQYVVNGNETMSALEKTLSSQLPLVGTQVGLSPWVHIDQKTIDNFAILTKDSQFIHINPKRAAVETTFGGTVAHGFLTLSFASHFIVEAIAPLPDAIMNLNSGFDTIRFLNPVLSGSNIRGVFTLKDVTQRSETQLRFVFHMTIEIEGKDRPALVADWINTAVFPALE
ncbi:MAG: MaoC family dehydratase [Planktomarina sp.]|nr:MaoC family dehydratase [Planktomarina sp.]MDS9950699.1 MaoC family dehydratase [Planktomarina sp.]|tara:strand:- start:25861 stop:26379 length:519 start_codon:yes stop_codon:yes gene_type:complete